MKRNLQRGDATLVTQMTKARKLYKGEGYAFRYVYEVLNGNRSNDEIIGLHDELVALRTSKRRK